MEIQPPLPSQKSDITHNSLQSWQVEAQTDTLLLHDSLPDFVDGQAEISTIEQPQMATNDLEPTISLPMITSTALGTGESLLSEYTTLCSLALPLVMTNNRKGYSPVDLEIRLRAGYRCGIVASEGCRIENKVLFNVLAEIS